MIKTKQESIASVNLSAADLEILILAMHGLKNSPREVRPEKQADREELYSYLVRQWAKAK